MNVITRAVVQAALLHLDGGTAARRLPAAFVTSTIAQALAKHDRPSPIRAQLDGRSLAAEAKRLGAWTAEPGRGYIWLSPGACGVVVELDGDRMTTVESDGRTVSRRTRPVSEATLGFLDPGMLANRA